MNHTPTPWKVVKPGHDNPDKSNFRCVQIGKDDSYTTLELLPEDARFLVRAANAYDDLMAACQAAAKALPVLAAMLDAAGLAGVEIARQIHRDCAAALKKGRGE